MTERPHITCMMGSSLDGQLHLSRRTASLDGTTKDGTAVYGYVDDAAGADGWIAGRTTMAEMAKVVPHLLMGLVELSPRECDPLENGAGLLRYRSAGPELVASSI